MRDAVAVARYLIGRHGDNAAAIAEQRAHANHQHGTADDAAFWSEVAQAVRALQQK